jgi:hypothetical protein
MARRPSFLRREVGALSVEAAILFPVLALAMLASVDFYDAYRREATLAKAGYAIADLVAQQARLRPGELDSLSAMLAGLNGGGAAPQLRLSVIGRDRDGLTLRGSETMAGGTALDRAALARLAPRIPPMREGEALTVIEVFAVHRARVAVGLPERRVHHVIATPQALGVPLVIGGG